MTLKSFYLTSVLLIAHFNLAGQDNPYEIMGCKTPVLDCIDPDNNQPHFAEIILNDNSKANLITEYKTNTTYIIATSGDTLAYFNNDARNALMFISVDKLSEENYSVSPYTYCNGNPLRFIDPDGLKPTEVEAARMAAYVYKDEYVELTGGWEVSPITDYNLNKGNGLKCMLFERALPDDRMEYVLAFAGTDSYSIDMLHDIIQPFGFSSQYNDARNLARTFVRDHRNEVTFVGHSLGGGLSATCAFAVGGQAITFNAAGITRWTQSPNRHTTIDAYITRNDPLHTIQLFLGIVANGNIIYREPKPNTTGHTIKNFY